VTPRRLVPRRRVLAAALAATGGAIAPARGQQLGFPYGDLKEVTLQGRLVNLQEELPSKYGARVPPGAPPQWVFATPEGRYYSLLDTDAARRLSTARPAAVEVRARHFPRSAVLEVLSFQPVAPELLRRRFYCGVCDITTEDFGPCACCGKEMELVGPPK
jgi:hypothetical protein